MSNIILNRNFINFAYHLVFRSLRKCFINQALLRALVHEPSSLKALLAIEAEFWPLLASVIAHDIPRDILVWFTLFLLHDVWATLSLLVDVEFTVLCFLTVLCLGVEDLGQFRLFYVNMGFWCGVS